MSEPSVIGKRKAVSFPPKYSVRSEESEVAGNQNWGPNQIARGISRIKLYLRNLYDKCVENKNNMQPFIYELNRVSLLTSITLGTYLLEKFPDEDDTFKIPLKQSELTKIERKIVDEIKERSIHFGALHGNDVKLFEAKGSLPIGDGWAEILTKGYDNDEELDLSYIKFVQSSLNPITPQPSFGSQDSVYSDARIENEIFDLTSFAQPSEGYNPSIGGKRKSRKTKKSKKSKKAKKSKKERKTRKARKSRKL
jgi:hypothetical protein